MCEGMKNKMEIIVPERSTVYEPLGWMADCQTGWRLLWMEWTHIARAVTPGCRFSATTADHPVRSLKAGELIAQTDWYENKTYARVFITPIIVINISSWWAFTSLCTAKRSVDNIQKYF